jgi:hypothetical protein
MREGPDPRYWRYDDVVSKLAGWQREHPELFRREGVGRTRRGEPIWAARVARETDAPSGRPALLIMAAQHANEPNGTGAVMRLISRLLEGEGTDERISAFVSGLEVWTVPIVNVDGHRIAFGGEPGWREWRKNARDNDGDGAFSPDSDGVDLNRNWDHRFLADPSVDPKSRNYKGPRPFSEPEVAAVRDLVLRERPVFVVDLHSPGRVTPPNSVFWPWLERGTGRLSPDAAVYRPISRALAARTETEVDGAFMDGDGYGFDTLPKAQNWVYGETGACALLMEISSRFWWEGPVIDRIAERVARGLVVLLERALGGPGLTGRVTDASTGASLLAEVRVEEMHDPEIGPRRTDPRTGIFRRLLDPGVVTVTVLADGHEPSTRRVAIAAGGWTTLDVQLRTR